MRGINYLKEYMKIYASDGTLEHTKKQEDIFVIKSGKMFKTNDFKIVPFEVKHDAREPLNFVLKNKIGEYMFYITDTGQLKFSVKNIKPTYILIEANFDENDFDEANFDENDYLKTHMMRNMMLDTGHLSVQKTIKILDTFKLSMCKQITLCHVSVKNGHSNFYKKIENATTKNTKQLPPHNVTTYTINKKEIPF
jgi:phosphoribosyl 1,2-cyclic phosphodiesterase